MSIHSVFITHIERLRRLVIAMGLSADEGQDILQDVYIEAVKGPPRDLGDQKALKWLMKVAVNRCLLEFRQRKRHNRAADEILRQWEELKNNSSLPDMQAIQAEEVQALMQCLHEMDESLRVPLAMRYFCDLNSTEIGAILDLKPGAVRKRLYKGRIILAEALLQKGIKL